MNTSFVHLKTHTEYSLSDGLLRIPDMISKACQSNMQALAISDRMNLFGLIKFYKQALQAGIKPLIACDVLVEDEAEEIFQLTLFAMNMDGYRNIRKLLSKAYQENLALGTASIKRAWLNEFHTGLLVLSAGKQGDIGQALLMEKYDLAKQRLEYWQALFPQRFYLELQRTGRIGDEKYLHAAVKLAQQYDCPVVATNAVCFLSASEFEAHEARVCIHDSRTLNDPRRERKHSDQQYFKTAEEMQTLFSDIPEAIENTVEIAKRCNVHIELGKHYLPDYPIPEGMTLEVFFRKLCKQGLAQRLAKDIVIGDGEVDYSEEDYWRRLDFEIDVILQMGFPGYFLIVMDFIRWAKKQGIPVGPGRGSGAGSLVAYVLEITGLDPLRYDLLFERFLNPERVSMPDFDVDFCQERRDEVIQYVADTYGTNAVSQIITFGTMAAKAVVRDVARVQGKPYGLADKLSKMIPFALGMTLEKAYQAETAIQEFLAQDEDAQGIWDMALQLEGTTRNTGKHAAGVVIAPSQLSDFTPVYCVEGEDVLISQFDKDDVEDVGLVKFDFLGLKNLTVIQWAVETINVRLAKEEQALIDITQIPLDDVQAFELLQQAKTTAVFQLESAGMKELIAKLKPNSFEDIIALVALYRPGPLESGMVDDFINRKHGRQELAYPHPKFQHQCLVPVLKPTYGIILYQEQVMQIAREMGGYSLGAADMLRRAMGKKKPEEMAKQREQFLAGAIEKGFDQALASNIFDLMEKFAGYGFNKSHSAAYALVAYQTAWLKSHYPAAFMAAVMSADLQNTDKIVTLIEECRSLDLKVLQPDINQGHYLFTVDDSDQIIYGLGAIKGLGEGPIECLIAERQASGPFVDLFDLCARTDSRKLNKRSLEAIILSGAMDSLAEERSLLMASLPEAMQAAEQKAKNVNAGMMDLFGEVVSSSSDAMDVYEHFRGHQHWSLKQKLRGEKETLGLYLTGHPIDVYEREITHLASMRLSELKKSEGQRILGLILSVRTIKTKRGTSMAIISLDDRTGRIEVPLFSEMYERFRDKIQVDELIVIEGNIDEDRYSGGLKVSVKDIYTVDELRAQRLKKVRVHLQQSTWTQHSFCQHLEKMLSENVVDGAPCDIELRCCLDDTQVNICLGEQWKLKPTENALQALRQCYGQEAIELVY